MEAVKLDLKHNVVNNLQVFMLSYKKTKFCKPRQRELSFCRKQNFLIPNLYNLIVYTFDISNLHYLFYQNYIAWNMKGLRKITGIRKLEDVEKTLIPIWNIEQFRCQF